MIRASLESLGDFIYLDLKAVKVQMGSVILREAKTLESMQALEDALKEMASDLAGRY